MSHNKALLLLLFPAWLLAAERPEYTVTGDLSPGDFTVEKIEVKGQERARVKVRFRINPEWLRVKPTLIVNSRVKVPLTETGGEFEAGVSLAPATLRFALVLPTGAHRDWTLDYTPLVPPEIGPDCAKYGLKIEKGGRFEGSRFIARCERASKPDEDGLEDAPHVWLRTDDAKYVKRDVARTEPFAEIENGKVWDLGVLAAEMPHEFEMTHDDGKLGRIRVTNEGGEVPMRVRFQGAAGIVTRSTHHNLLGDTSSLIPGASLALFTPLFGGHFEASLWVASGAAVSEAGLNARYMPFFRSWTPFADLGLMGGYGDHSLPGQLAIETLVSSRLGLGVMHSFNRSVRFAFGTHFRPGSTPDLGGWEARIVDTALRGFDLGLWLDWVPRGGASSSMWFARVRYVSWQFNTPANAALNGSISQLAFEIGWSAHTRSSGRNRWGVGL